MTVREIQRNIFDITFGPHRFICSYIGKQWELMDSAQGHITVYKTRAKAGIEKVKAWIEQEYGPDG